MPWQELARQFLVLLPISKGNTMAGEEGLEGVVRFVTDEIGKASGDEGALRVTASEVVAEVSAEIAAETAAETAAEAAAETAAEIAGGAGQQPRS
jgi:hypothetical protein